MINRFDGGAGTSLAMVVLKHTVGPWVSTPLLPRIKTCVLRGIMRDRAP